MAEKINVEKFTMTDPKLKKQVVCKIVRGYAHFPPFSGDGAPVEVYDVLLNVRMEEVDGRTLQISDDRIRTRTYEEALATLHERYVNVFSVERF